MTGCVAPIVVKAETGLLSEVACGQCRSCRLRRKRAWVGRLILESKRHAFSRFITLTYKDDPGILDYRDFELFMKRYREKHGKVRFFVVGEYGGRNARGHYHAILFGHAPECVGHSLSLREVWQLGYCYDGTVTPASISYVSGYCFKENYSPGKMPFVQMSRKPGIGMESIAEMGKRLSTYPLQKWPSTYSISGKRYPLCSGGLKKFQTVYLENGGSPPASSDPMERDFFARNRHHPEFGRGSLVFEERLRSIALNKRYSDDSALKKER